MKGRSFLSTANLSPAELQQLLSLSQNYCDVNNNHRLLPHKLLRGKMIAPLFFEASTRTKVSFERAARNLGADLVDLQIGASSIIKGESVLETARTLQAMAIDALVVRHASSGLPAFLADNLHIPVINAGDGWHEHPTQALLDLLTISQEFGSFAGLNVLFLGDIRHSRVARSNLFAMQTLGIKVRMAGPPTLVPPEMKALGAEIVRDIDQAAAEADVVYLLRIQWERQQSGFVSSLSEYSKLYGMDEERLALLQSHAILLHPGPANVGVELSAAAYAWPRSRIEAQVNNGVAARMAVLHWLLAGD
ncbi:MAG: aspartate carbamoyltransferase catalytic subunit [Dethiobacter sp.]|jgi:aspartate carbamoyltransferase catalytic subunit|nr:aspartate carbamoyltransferase catalytic subunit [Dethiobacter sp.]MBS3902489.1 aspartate carbamoyltransferase catalytic subunit [Dethiobacter sp.]MBS3989928.1 aspartate carbamoyltransferase catalytic subunit [Dethiobacter sp.]MBS3990399.1 aspartate carbamoyltransferase catalytic subunit [Dethiobacter sp.]